MSCSFDREDLRKKEVNLRMNYVLFFLRNLEVIVSRFES